MLEGRILDDLGYRYSPQPICFVSADTDELKVIYDGEHEVSDYGIHADHYLLQPCDVGDPLRNREILDETVAYVLAHPQWRLSLQQHKLLGVR